MKAKSLTIHLPGKRNYHLAKAKALRLHWQPARVSGKVDLGAALLRQEDLHIYPRDAAAGFSDIKPSL